MTVTLGLNMHLISSLSSSMFRRRISIHGLFRLNKQGTSCKNQPALGSAHYRTTVWQWLDILVLRRYIGTGVQLHGMHNDQNLTPVDFYMKSLVYTDGICRVSKFFSKTYLKIMTKLDAYSVQE
ncbi:hypothetical protein SFRURICE_016419 [Spodoptera frugiperda]|nr:hypothetical protein SFRURICE_016419 [Spodoptera frugiperda]